MPRQRLPAGEARTEVLYTLVRPRERVAIDALAAGLNRSRSHVIRQAVLAYTAEHHDDDHHHHQDGDHNQAVADARRA